MNNKEELVYFAKMILEDERLSLVIADLKDQLSTSILESEIGDSRTRDDSHMTWKGANAFLSILQSYVDSDNIEERNTEAKEEAIFTSEMKQEAKMNALKDL